MHVCLHHCWTVSLAKNRISPACEPLCPTNKVTIASHFIFGTYLLGSLAMPTLLQTPESRFIAVSSGGMYNFGFPSWEVATWTSTDPSLKYDGTTAYAYAKRGQVLLCERWAKAYPAVKVVSCHPGWTSTDGVDAAFGDQKKYLEPLRTGWQGAEGIAWLCVAPANKIESGAFYLDRCPQVKHIAGPFFTEGSYTKNTPEDWGALLEPQSAIAESLLTNLKGLYDQGSLLAGRKCKRSAWKVAQKNEGGKRQIVPCQQDVRIKPMPREKTQLQQRKHHIFQPSGLPQYHGSSSTSPQRKEGQRKDVPSPVAHEESFNGLV